MFTQNSLHRLYPQLSVSVSLFLFLTLISVVAVWVEPSDRLLHLHELWGEEEKKSAGVGWGGEGGPYTVLGVTAGGTFQTLNP